MKAEIKNKAWLRRQIAAAAAAELLVNVKPFVPVANQEFTECSYAMKILADMREGPPRLVVRESCGAYLQKT